jgi:hypothetical protein
VPDGDESVALVDTRTLQRRARLPAARLPLYFGTNFLWAISPANELVRLELPGGAVSRRFPLRDFNDPPGGVVSPDGRFALLHDRVCVAITPLPPAGPVVFRESPTEQGVTDAAVSPDGRLGLTVFGHAAVLWNLATGRPTRTNTFAPELHCARFLGPELCLLGGTGRQLLLWRLGETNAPQALGSPLESTYDLALAPAADRVLVAGGNGRLGLTQLTTGQPLTWFTHGALQRSRGEHQFRRLVTLPGGDAVAGLTDGGRLVLWRAYAASP